MFPENLVQACFQQVRRLNQPILCSLMWWWLWCCCEMWSIAVVQDKAQRAGASESFARNNHDSSSHDFCHGGGRGECATHFTNLMVSMDHHVKLLGWCIDMIVGGFGGFSFGTSSDSNRASPLCRTSPKTIKSSAPIRMESTCWGSSSSVLLSASSLGRWGKRGGSCWSSSTRWMKQPWNWSR